MSYESRFMLTFFGIEFETCVCNNTGKINSPTDFVEMLQRRTDQKGVVFRYQEDPRIDIDYTKWSVTYDGSVECDAVNKISYLQGEKTNEPCTKKNIALELVTPIYNYSLDYGVFEYVVNKTLFSDEFVYESNPSQGMHINVSYLGHDYNPLKVLEMWWYFEPLIMKFIPLHRRYSRFAKPLRGIFPTIEDLRQTETTFYANPDKPRAKYTALCKKSDRFEFRLVPASMSIEHIMCWLGFCVRFVVSSCDFEIPDDKDSGTFEELFSLIRNKNIKSYFRELLDKNPLFSSIDGYVELYKSASTAEEKQNILDEYLTGSDGQLNALAEYIIIKAEKEGRLHGDDKDLLSICYDSIFALSEPNAEAINTIVELYYI